MKRSRLPRVSKKRRAAMRDGEKAEGPCELTPFLAGITAWQMFDYPKDWADSFERHHVFRMRHLLDDPRFVLNVSTAAHRWCHEVWDKGGFVACMFALWKLDRLDVDAVRAEQKCPVFRVEEWLKAGNFDSSPIVVSYARFLVRECGR